MATGNILPHILLYHLKNTHYLKLKVSSGHECIQAMNQQSGLIIKDSKRGPNSNLTYRLTKLKMSIQILTWEVDFNSWQFIIELRKSKCLNLQVETVGLPITKSIINHQLKIMP